MTFNKTAADQVYGQIMKMDSDSALVYGRMLLGAAVQNDLIVHGEEIATEVSKMMAERVEVARAGLIRTSIAKARSGEDNTVELATLVELEKGFFGSLFSTYARERRTRDQKRDPNTGRFEVMHEQIHDDPRAEIIPGRYASKLKLPVVDDEKFNHLTPAQKAQLQSSFAQVQRLIRPYSSMPGQKGLVTYHYEDGINPTWQHINGGVPQLATVAEDGKKTGGIDPDRKLRAITVDVVPGNDAAGGLFRTFNALGMPGVGAMAAGATVKDNKGALTPEGLADIHDRWNKKSPEDQFKPGVVASRRVIAGSQLIESTFGPALPPQVKMATQVAQHIGRLGPNAAQIITPTMDRAAYRYRGTERTPDRNLLNAQSEDKLRVAQEGGVARELQERARAGRQEATTQFRQVEFNHKKAVDQVKADWDEAAQQFQRGMISGKEYNQRRKEGQKALSDHAARLAAARKSYDKRIADTSGSEHQAEQMGHETWVKRMVNGRTEKKTGRWQESKVIGYMRSRIPSPELNELQLKSGVVPPSEGVIIGADGQVKAQTIGYGDDHYLPFTLRNLAGLRGGYYVRTRTFGGPTSEDVYTALISGARGLTVVSNNGTFSLEFDHDFKGGRRMNDKAARMVARYGNLLDAVQSGKVTGGQLSPSRLGELHRKAAADGQGDAAATKRLFEDYKAKELKNPRLSSQEREKVVTDYLSTRLDEAGADVVDTGPARAGMMSSRKMRSGASSLDEIAAYAASRQATVAQPGQPAAVRNGHAQMLLQQWQADPAAMPEHVADALGMRTEVEQALREASEQNRKRIQPLQLDGRGYQVALQALQQQFPYYIAHTDFHEAHDGVDSLDTGYVKPKHNRTADALVGYWDPTINGGGKAAADSVRYQNGNRRNIVFQTASTQQRHDQDPAPAAAAATPAAAAGSTAAPAAPAAGQTDTQLQRKADEALVKHLHSLANQPMGEEMAEFHKSPALATGKIRTLNQSTLDNPALDPVRKIYGTVANPISEQEALTAVAGGRLTHEDLAAGVKWLQANLTWHGKLDQDVIENHIRRGKATPIVTFPASDPAEAVKDPDRDWDFSGWSPFFAKGSGAVPAEFASYYSDARQFEPFIASGQLPATLDARDFDQRTKAMLKQVSEARDAHAAWKHNNEVDAEPMPPARQHQMAFAAIQARQLHRRYMEAHQRNADAAAAAAKEEAQRETHVTVVQDDGNGGMKAIEPANEPDWVKQMRAAGLNVQVPAQ